MKKILITIICACAAMPLLARDYYASEFGIKSNGTTLNTTSIQKAIDFISEQGGGRLCFKVGRYLTGTIHIKSNVTIDLGEGAVLVGSPNPYDYDKVDWAPAFIAAENAENIAITGLGVIDGNGREVANNYLAQVAAGFIKDPLKLGRVADRPHGILLVNCKNVLVEGINVRSAACWTFTVDRCTNLHIKGVTVDSRAFWNNDGIDIVDCKDAVIEDCFVNAADDGICLKSHKAHLGDENITVRHNVITSSASGIKFGTFGLGGFRNIQCIDNTVYDTFRSAIAIESVDGGQSSDIVVDGLKSLNTANAIFLIVGQRRGEKPSTLERVTIRNVYAEVPVDKPDYGVDYEGPTLEDMPRNVGPCVIVGLKDQRVKDVTIENVQVNYPGGGDPTFAKVGTNELDKVPEMPTAYPEFSQFKELPAWGFWVRHADNIVMKNVVLKAAVKDYRPAVVLDDVKDSDVKGVKATAPQLKGKVFVAKNCKNIKK